MASRPDWQSQVLAVLRASPVFGLLDAVALNDLVASLELQAVDGGTLLFRDGDPADSMILVISGRLRVWRWGVDGKLMLYNEISPGETVGETGMILHQHRPANVTALRDSTVAVLSRPAFEALVARQPVALNRAFSQAIYNHLRHSGKLAERPKAESFAVVPLSDPDSARAVAEGLANACAIAGRADHVHVESARGQMLHAASLEDRVAHLDTLEREYDFLVFEADHQASPWTRSAVRQTDQVIFVADAQSSPAPTAIERILADEPGFSMKRKHLVLLYPAGASHPVGVGRWRASRDVERVYPVRQGNLEDFSRLMRFLTGHAVGLVLGGGGARGFAHLGVLKALEEHGIPIDLVGGNSMGALIGAQYVLGVPLDEIRERTRAFAKAGEVPTVPTVSLLSGRRLEANLKAMFGDTVIEDLWRPYFAAACNLSRATTAVQDSGPLWRAVLASNSPAGLLPPVLSEGELLVDGAILDNVPVGDMRVRLGTPNERRRGNGVVIAVDVDVAEEFCVDPALTKLPVWRRGRGQGEGGKPLPGIVDILYRAGHIGGLSQRARTASLADFYLAPPVGGFALMGYPRAKEIAEVGYRYAAEEIGRWNLLARPNR